MLKRILPRSVTYTKDELRRDEEFLFGQPPHEVSPFVDVLARFLVAFLIGALLVVPTLVMRLPNVNVVKSLCTVLFVSLDIRGCSFGVLKGEKYGYLDRHCYLCGSPCGFRWNV